MRSVPYQLGGAHAPPSPRPRDRTSLQHAAGMSRWSESWVRPSICIANELMAVVLQLLAPSSCKASGRAPAQGAPLLRQGWGVRRGLPLVPAAPCSGVTRRGHFSLDLVFRAACMWAPVGWTGFLYGKGPWLWTPGGAGGTPRTGRSLRPWEAGGEKRPAWAAPHRVSTRSGHCVWGTPGWGLASCWVAGRRE